MRRLILTTGDVDGVGAEITAKSLRQLRLSKQQSVCVILQKHQLKSFQKLVGHKIHVFENEAQVLSLNTAGISVLLRNEAPAFWVEWAAQACMKGEFDALVTGPLSKPGIRAAGLRDLGHTEILARVSGARTLFMSFWGQYFNVVLVTGHIALAKVPTALSSKRLQQAAAFTHSFLNASRHSRRAKPLAWIGLNPHAGDKNLIGRDESRLVRQLEPGPAAKLRGPLVPDTAFQKENWSKYSAYLCAYHDQGLIPFKLVHGFDEGVHVTLGLPFLRTSVDHGPAKELVGTGKARHGSMKAAIKMALDFRS